ncbi:sulfatase-like hydrolase/transferase [Nocardioides donggukensis]|uniref:Sulfatase-like hydrolase/transferase n=1 Tax=Nocardioides donggukensis TaxID=2774019 RepID=A0A927K394_9ACTN|nr:sulfatase-like hydrolase/transferase [Nocardioides donggukensis]MBD8868145.1 sulfatase-like hydrolase/transferase [Nocardioides donggukensis]
MHARVVTAVLLAVLVSWSAVALAHSGDGVATAVGPDQQATGPRSAADTVVRAATGARPVLAPPPNVVLVLLDDFSLDLLPTMRHARRMQRRGATYRNAFVVDSLCCVSRASLLTGQYPHQTGVLTNTANTPNPYGPIGGWEAYAAYGNEERTVSRALQRRGYTTGFIGKFLNQYEARDGVVPPLVDGWDEFNVIFGSAYDGWGFQSSYVEDGRLRVRDHPAPPADADDATKDAAYVGAVTEQMALDFLDEHGDDEAPYFLEVASYSPHSRVGPEGAYPGDPVFPPAFRDRAGPGRGTGNCGLRSCPRLTERDLVGFGDPQDDNLPRYADGSRAPSWKGEAAPLAAEHAADSLRNRARMVASVDRMLGRILDAVDDDTYVVLTSDNGFHLGQHGLGRGKGTPYDSDVHVPLVVTGPGVVPGVRREVVSNIDLAPTFEELAGATSPRYRAGTSLVPTFADRDLDRRGVTFIEHTWAPSLGFDPDRSYSGGTIDRIPSYVAVRSRTGLLVRLDLDPSWEGEDVAWEFYDYRDAPFERTNTVARADKRAEVRFLKKRIRGFLDCRDVRGSEPVSARCRRLTQ